MKSRLFITVLTAIPFLLFSGEQEDRIVAFLRFCFQDVPREEISLQQPFHRGHNSARNYVIEAGDEKFVMRLFRDAASEEEVQKELYMMEQASRLGVSPQLYTVSIENRIALMEYMGAKTITPKIASLHAKEAGQAIAIAHSIPQNPTQTPQYLDEADFRYKFISERMNIPEAKQDIELIRSLAPKLSQKKANVHCDLHPHNLFWTDDGLKIIDWENTVWDHPYFDLTYFVILQALDEESEEQFLEGYFDRPPTMEEREEYLLAKKVNLAHISLTNFKIAAAILENEAEPFDKEAPLQDLYYYMSSFAGAGKRMPVQYFYDMGRLTQKMSMEM